MSSVFRRLRNISLRQSMALAVMGALFAGTVVSAALGSAEAAAGFLAAMVMLLFVGMLQLRRRLEQSVGIVRTMQRNFTVQLRDATGSMETNMERATFSFNRVLAAVETERLEAADRHQAIVKLLDTAERSAAR